jgi:hypothetical protein
MERWVGRKGWLWLRTDTQGDGALSPTLHRRGLTRRPIHSDIQLVKNLGGRAKPGHGEL